MSNQRAPRTIALIGLAAVSITALGACTRADAAPKATTKVVTARSTLDTLTVKGRAPKTGYSRDQFGPRWTDNVPVQGGHNGCDTRNDVLRRDLRGTTIEARTKGCVVLSGSMTDPYTGKAVTWTKAKASALQVDHVAALSDVWQKGARSWTPAKRASYANDPLVLVLADGPANMAKGDRDAASWLPANKGYRCAYVARQIAVKSKYGVWVTSAEKDAMARVLSSCPNQPLPTDAQAAVPAPVR